MVAGTMEGMRTASRYEPEFLLKLDTDALVIGSFADRLREAFADDRVGLVGSYTHTCTGAQRDFTEWEPKLRRASRSVFYAVRDSRYACARRIKPGPSGGFSGSPRTTAMSGGANCLGGAYAAGPEMLSVRTCSIGDRGFQTWISEDVVVGLLAQGFALGIRGDVDTGGVFALAWQSLPLPPERLIEQRLLRDPFSAGPSSTETSGGTAQRTSAPSDPSAAWRRRRAEAEREWRQVVAGHPPRPSARSRHQEDGRNLSVKCPEMAHPSARRASAVRLAGRHRSAPL